MHNISLSYLNFILTMIDTLEHSIYNKTIKKSQAGPPFTFDGRSAYSTPIAMRHRIAAQCGAMHCSMREKWWQERKPHTVLFRAMAEVMMEGVLPLAHVLLLLTASQTVLKPADCLRYL